MMWRTYDSIPLTRLNTVAYENATAAFRRAIGSRGQTQVEPWEVSDGADRDENPIGTPELVQRLCELLGAKLVAYLGSMPDTRTVREWADPAGSRTPPHEVIDRLRIAHRVAALL